MPATVATSKELAALDKRLQKLENISRRGKTLQMVVDRLSRLENTVQGIHDMIQEEK